MPDLCHWTLFRHNFYELLIPTFAFGFSSLASSGPGKKKMMKKNSNRHILLLWHVYVSQVVTRKSDFISVAVWQSVGDIRQRRRWRRDVVRRALRQPSSHCVDGRRLQLQGSSSCKLPFLVLSMNERTDYDKNSAGHLMWLEVQAVTSLSK